ncbi:NAD-dependent protein lipoamidase sirtuin-4 [Lunasporangiospora selenospora]|uniref:NAD-dependent protein lipoamidase sirtuin-4 n=1 Tax=Lunasporangiospora selenospora TaxID=979761 RepID=A0A9P6FQT1_9FUNG|nr:NAD-dependent protein lipoamidase sirtuin-4 [Lunasporangiospora selenospora]
MRLRITLRTVSNALEAARSPAVAAGPGSAPFDLAVRELTSFLGDGNVTVLTGAGVSTDSAIPDYRGEHGTYTTNPNYKPIFYQAFVSSDEARHRYWARSFLGFPPIVTTDPNPSHYAIAALQRPRPSQSIQSLIDQYPIQEPPNEPNEPKEPKEALQPSVQEPLGQYVRSLITQNVDGLHQKAGSKNVLELHGTLHRVHCLNCGQVHNRADFQQTLARLNPAWDNALRSQSASSLYSRMNADGDVELNTTQSLSGQSTLDYHSFKYPICSSCNKGHYKPSVVFFGENVPVTTKEETTEAILQSNGLLVVGTSLATYSAFRLIKLAKDSGIPIAMINLGPSRGDPLADIRYDGGSSLLLKAVARELGLGEIPGEIKHRKQTLNAVGS